MRRRTAGEDPDFGSDSFLDIIANIVGILIILIVVAGVKVARQPPVAATAVAASNTGLLGTEVSSHREHKPGIRLSSEHLRLLQAETAVKAKQVTRLQDEYSELLSNSAELTDRISQLRQQAAEVKVAIASRRQQAKRSDSDIVALTGDVNELRNLVAVLQDQTAAGETQHQAIFSATRLVYDRQAAADSDLKEITVQTQKLQEVIEEQQSQAALSKDRLEHRLSPVVRTDSEQELHFRLSGGRISWVPIEPLLERLKRQVANRADVIRRFGQYEGICGPVGGYTMKYAVARQAPSLLEGVHGTSSGFRIAVSRWTVIPVESLHTESVDEAIKFGSRFRQIAEAADFEALLTVWLYPDDFAHFRKLREFGHGLGLRVAARPLPADAEITGSPGGSRSSGQ